jgi:hypothetical protein
MHNNISLDGTDRIADSLWYLLSLCKEHDIECLACWNSKLNNNRWEKYDEFIPPDMKNWKLIIIFEQGIEKELAEFFIYLTKKEKKH